MSPAAAYERATKHYRLIRNGESWQVGEMGPVVEAVTPMDSLSRAIRRRSDLVARRALLMLGIREERIVALLATYTGGSTRERIVMAYEHAIHQPMRKAA